MNWIIGKIYKCIDNRNASNTFTIGQYYILTSTGKFFNGGIQLYFDGKIPGPWRTWRFDPTPLDLDSVAPMNSSIASTSTISTSTYSADQEEERLWKAMRPSQLAHECICGIARVDCQYHR